MSGAGRRFSTGITHLVPRPSRTALTCLIGADGPGNPPFEFPPTHVLSHGRFAQSGGGDGHARFQEARCLVEHGQDRGRRERLALVVGASVTGGSAHWRCVSPRWRRCAPQGSPGRRQLVAGREHGHRPRLPHGDAAEQRQVLVAGGVPVGSAPWRARSCTTRRPTRGPRPPHEPGRASAIRRRCSERQGAGRRRPDDGSVRRARSCTTRRPTAGRAAGSHEHRPRRSHRDAAERRQGAGRWCGAIQGFGLLASAELYDPATNTWQPAGAHEHSPRLSHRDAAAERQGAGGGRPRAERSTASAELYDPATNVWQAAASMSTPRTLTPRRCWATARCWWRAATKAP